MENLNNSSQDFECQREMEGEEGGRGRGGGREGQREMEGGEGRKGEGRRVGVGGSMRGEGGGERGGERERERQTDRQTDRQARRLTVTFVFFSFVARFDTRQAVASHSWLWLTLGVQRIISLPSIHPSGT